MTTNAHPPATASRQMVLVFTDLAESVARKQRLGNAAYVDHIQRRHDALFREVLAEYPGGVIHNDTGDGFLAEFRTSADAVCACLRFQHTLHTTDWEGEEVRVHIGIHVGQVAEVDPDPAGATKLIGLATDLTARLMGLARPGQILRGPSPGGCRKPLESSAGRARRGNPGEEATNAKRRGP